mgnify:CR=1 FL=1
MSDIEIACHGAPWGKDGLINSLADVERAGFRGIETTAEVVELFEDRVAVFNEILVQHRLELASITAGGSKWPGMNLDEEVERGVNVARFLRSAGAKVLVLYPPRPNPEQELEDELDLLPAATAYGEIARRTLEQGVLTCLHPEVGTLVDSPRMLDKFIQMADPEAMKLCVDVGFLAEAKVPMAAFLKEHKKRLGIVHLKDVRTKDLKPRKFVGKGKHKTLSHPHVCELGKGDLDLEEFVELVLDEDYSGWMTVEFDSEKGRTNAQLAAACYKYAEQHLDLVL